MAKYGGGLDSFLSGIFNKAMTRNEDTVGGSFMQNWKGADSVITRTGSSSTEAVSAMGEALGLERERSSEGLSDLNLYFSDLDDIQSELGDIAKLMSPATGDPIKDRASLRAARAKGLRERAQARSRLQSQSVGRLDESSSYIDPMTGERIQLDATSGTQSDYDMVTEGLSARVGEFYDKALADYYQENRYDIDTTAGLSLFSDRTETGIQGNLIQKALTREEYLEDVAAGKTITTNAPSSSLKTAEGRALQYAMGAESVERDMLKADKVSKGEKVAVGQAKQTFEQLATSAAMARMQGLQSELNLRKEAAIGELEARKKANANISNMERKRVQQVRELTNSMDEINRLFALQDSKFLAAENSATGSNGVDFREDRPQ